MAFLLEVSVEQGLLDQQYIVLLPNFFSCGQRVVV